MAETSLVAPMAPLCAYAGSPRSSVTGMIRTKLQKWNRLRPRLLASRPKPHDEREEFIMSAVTRLALVALACAIAAPASAQLLQRKDLSSSMAATIVQTAAGTGQGKGFNVSAVVVDRAGGTL